MRAPQPFRERLHAPAAGHLRRRRAERSRTPAPAPLKVLLVVPHPDDEYYFAATVYRLANELGAVVDQVVITGGEGGFRYAALAERIYGVPLTAASDARRHLPAIRRRETLAAGRILGVRRHHFLNQPDSGFTLAPAIALDREWDTAQVRATLRELLESGRYDFVFTLLPGAAEHGHHKAAAHLVLDVAGQLDEAARPVVLGAAPGRRNRAGRFTGLKGFATCQSAHPEPAFVFDRRAKFGFEGALDYRIPVRWAVAEHKSQGMFQAGAGRHDAEFFWRFAIGPADAQARTEALAGQLLKA